MKKKLKKLKPYNNFTIVNLLNVMQHSSLGVLFYTPIFLLSLIFLSYFSSLFTLISVFIENGKIDFRELFSFTLISNERLIVVECDDSILLNICDLDLVIIYIILLKRSFTIILCLIVTPILIDYINYNEFKLFFIFILPSFFATIMWI